MSLRPFTMAARGRETDVMLLLLSLVDFWWGAPCYKHGAPAELSSLVDFAPHPPPVLPTGIRSRCTPVDLSCVANGHVPGARD